MILKKIKKAWKFLKEKKYKLFVQRFIYFFKQGTLQFLEIFCYPYAIFKIKRFNSKNSGEIFDFAYNFCFGLIRPMQIKEEFLEFLKIIQELNPKYILDIGTAKGGTLFLFARNLSDDIVIITIDQGGWPLSGGYPIWKRLIFKSFKKNNQKIHFIQSDSHNIHTLNKVKDILKNNTLDLIFIDGDHSYEGVKKDFEMYSPLARKGGIIALHDCLLNNDDFASGGVKRFWDNIKREYRFKEIIQEKDNKEFGIGVVSVD
jgi:predicted O-methyltransferase YrrM